MRCSAGSSWPPGRGHGRQRLLVAHQRGAVRVRRQRLLPGGVDGVLAQGVRQSLRVRQALPRLISTYRRSGVIFVLQLRDLLLHNSNRRHGRARGFRCCARLGRVVVIFSALDSTS